MNFKDIFQTPERRRFLAMLGAAAAWPTLASAADGMQLVVAYPPGASLDHMARAFAEQLRTVVGNQVIVENKAGANGIIAAQAVAGSTDGRTLLVTGGSLVTLNPYLYSDSKFDVNSLVPLGVLGFQSAALVVRAGSGIRSFKDFLARAKHKEMTYSSAGVASSGHQAMLQLQHEAGLKLLHVPYKGGAPAVTAVVSGEVDAALLVLGNVLPFIRQGKLDLLAVSSPQRLAATPQTPTMVESGLKDFVYRSATVIMASKAMPPAVLANLSGQVRRARESKEFQAALVRLGIESADMEGAETAAWLEAEAKRTQKLLTTYKIKAE